ncbi:YwqH-like family protein [Halobacillus salinus]|uniref:YwqH-like family protein n=1 Tax=Halobacillus salinus TaxID=192814 RepID=UPI0009A75FC7|nr:DUF5082 family protein [Halobacillus salinus]
MSLLLSILKQDRYQKERELAELQDCQRELANLQDELIQQQSRVGEPELSPNTWHGARANEFNGSREDMTDAYRDISKTQMNRAQDEVEQKIGQILQQLGYLEHQIAAERRRMEKEEEGA